MSFYDATVPAYLQILGALSGILGKAEAHCKAKNIQEDVLLSARLYPDRFPLARQSQTACDFAAKGCARLTGSDVPSTPDTEKSFADLQARIAKTIDYVKSYKPAQFDGADGRDVREGVNGCVPHHPTVLEHRQPAHETEDEGEEHSCPSSGTAGEVTEPEDRRGRDERDANADDGQ